MEEHCFNLVMVMLENHICNERYKVGVFISNAVSYKSHKVLMNI